MPQTATAPTEDTPVTDVAFPVRCDRHRLAVVSADQDHPVHLPPFLIDLFTAHPDRPRQRPPVPVHRGGRRAAAPVESPPPGMAARDGR